MINNLNKKILVALVFLLIATNDRGIVIGGELKKSKSKVNNSMSVDDEIKALANFCVAVDFMYENKWGKAVEFLLKTLELDERALKAHLYISSCYFQLKQVEKSIIHLKKAGEISPDDFDIHFTLGNILQANKNIDEAIKEFELAIGSGFGHNKRVVYADVLLNLAALYSRKGDSDKAISCLQAVIDLKITDDTAKLQFEIGRLHYENGDIENACNAFELIKNANPRSHTISPYLALCYEALKRYDDAIKEIKFFLKRLPNDWNQHLALHRIYTKTKDDSSADKHQQKAIYILIKSINIGSKDLNEYLTLAQLLLGKMDETGALNILQKGLGFCKDKAIEKDFHFMLSNVYYELNEYAKVEDELRKTLKIDPELHQANNFLGYFLAQMGQNLDEAVELIKKALKVNPENPAYIDSLGWAYFKKAHGDDKENQIEFALNKLLEAAGLVEDSEIQEHLGDVYYSLGEWNKAEKEWVKGLGYLNDDKARSVSRLARRIKWKVNKIRELRNFEENKPNIMGRVKHLFN